ncbi:meiotic nuclear division protein 1 homolog isoform X2 [Typha angustifolia]
MLQIFYETQDFFLKKRDSKHGRVMLLSLISTIVPSILASEKSPSLSLNKLKELEKLGPKKGVISQSVKDVVQSLVDDDLVLKDKIGTSVYFWSLPSCAGNQLRNTCNKFKDDLSSSKKRFMELVEQRDKLKKGREESDEREAALEELKTVELEHKKLKEELASYADNDPAALEAMKNATEIAHSAANRWTDNIFTLQQWCSTNFPEAKEQLEHMYKEVGITEDFEYLQ